MYRFSFYTNSSGQRGLVGQNLMPKEGPLSSSELLKTVDVT